MIHVFIHMPAPNLFRGSTAVVQLAVNQLVEGSIPSLGARIQGRNFVGECRPLKPSELGSSPSDPTILIYAQSLRNN